MYHQSMSYSKKNKYGIIGYASDLGCVASGPRFGPSALRASGMITALQSLGHEVRDYGDIEPLPSSEEALLKYLEIESRITDLERRAQEVPRIYASSVALYEKVKTAIISGYLPIVVGGDHSLSIGSVPAIAERYSIDGQKIGLLWIDTHADLNTPATSPSGRLFGMSVAVLTGLVPGLLSSIQRQFPAVDPKNVAYLGLREVDPLEKGLIRERGMTAFSMKDIDILGIANVLEKSFEVCTNGTAGFIVSFDLDVCDPVVAPGISTPKRGGLTFREAHLCMELIHDSGRMLGLEMVELNPTNDRFSETAELAVSLIESACGKTII